ncbi:SRPBCC family protein [Streptomyces sioyaensis]|uniref:SRPBCC family protein n=1 Tax=Streptomyces sioyaensis TaxID=67364 RepID=UPI001F2D3283|nr:SRPBCC family protein [Streptomyces sioyaensis]MCF3178338.1 SRPBCC family protein [Streptomyces sioyaensis]
MHHVEHTVTVTAPIRVVWDVLQEVRGYDRIFDSLHAVEVLESSDTHQLVRLTVEVNTGVVHTWVTRRDIDGDAHTIAFQQVEDLAPLVSHMGGEWRAFAVGTDRTQLVLTQDYAAREPVNGMVAGRFTPADTEKVLHGVAQRNGMNDLKSVKAEAESRIAADPGRIS